MQMPVTIDPRYHDAVLFDLDGVPVLDSMVDLLGRLHDAGVATAAYSSRRDWAHALLLYRHRRLPEARRQSARLCRRDVPMAAGQRRTRGKPAAACESSQRPVETGL